MLWKTKMGSISIQMRTYQIRISSWHCQKLTIDVFFEISSKKSALSSFAEFVYPVFYFILFSCSPSSQFNHNFDEKASRHGISILKSFFPFPSYFFFSPHICEKQYSLEGKRKMKYKKRWKMKMSILSIISFIVRKRVWEEK